jgi:hypothetical protein
MNIPDLESITSAVRRSLKQLVKRDGMLFEAPIEKHAPYDARKLHEVCINHKLAEYLAAEILPLMSEDHFFVDIEFNREGVNFKTIKIGQQVERVRPDIIIHNRRSGKAKANLLVAECKKSGCYPGEIAYDRKKIAALMTEKRYNYHFGLQVVYGRSLVRATLFYKPQEGIIRAADVMP